MGHDRPRLPGVVLGGAFWFIGLIVAAAIAPPVTAGEGSLWHDLRRAVGVPVAVGLIALGLVAASLVAAAAYGWLRVPGRKALDRVAYVTRMLPYWLRQLGRAGNPGSGESNRRYVTVEDFYKEDPRRKLSDELDYGGWWRDRGSDRVHRVTLIEATGELIAVARGQTGDGAVELLGVIPSEDEVNRRLADWAYVGETVASLSWVRQRAIGWRVPLPPRSRWLKRQEQVAMQPWPVPLRRARSVLWALTMDRSEKTSVVLKSSMQTERGRSTTTSGSLQPVLLGATAGKAQRIWLGACSPIGSDTCHRDVFTLRSGRT